MEFSPPATIRFYNYGMDFDIFKNRNILGITSKAASAFGPVANVTATWRIGRYVPMPTSNPLLPFNYSGITCIVAVPGTVVIGPDAGAGAGATA